MAAGHAVDGTDYNLLPGQVGNCFASDSARWLTCVQRGGAEYWEENAIAYFYNDVGLTIVASRKRYSLLTTASRYRAGCY